MAFHWPQNTRSRMILEWPFYIGDDGHFAQYYLITLLASTDHKTQDLEWSWNGHFMLMTMIILHILRTSSIVFMVLLTLLSLHYQVSIIKLSWHGSVDSHLLPQWPVQLNNYIKINCLWLVAYSNWLWIVLLSVAHVSCSYRRIGEENLYRHQNLIDFSLGHATPWQKISSQSIHNFLRYFACRLLQKRNLLGNGKQ